MIWDVLQISNENQGHVAVKWLTVHLVMLVLQYRRFSANKLLLSRCSLFARMWTYVTTQLLKIHCLEVQMMCYKHPFGISLNGLRRCYFPVTKHNCLKTGISGMICMVLLSCDCLFTYRGCQYYIPYWCIIVSSLC
jgi:hypothetical protein